MGLGVILPVILVLFVFGALPTWPYSRSWGYFPSGIYVVVLVILVMQGQIWVG